MAHLRPAADGRASHQAAPLTAVSIRHDAAAAEVKERTYPAHPAAGAISVAAPCLAPILPRCFQHPLSGLKQAPHHPHMPGAGLAAIADRAVDLDAALVLWEAEPKEAQLGEIAAHRRDRVPLIVRDAYAISYPASIRTCPESVPGRALERLGAERLAPANTRHRSMAQLLPPFRQRNVADAMPVSRLGPSLGQTSDSERRR